MSHLEITNQ